MAKSPSRIHVLTAITWTETPVRHRAMLIDKSTLGMDVSSCLVATCRWHRMTAHAPSGRPCSDMKDGAGLESQKQLHQRNTVTSMPSLGHQAQYLLPKVFTTSVLRLPTALVLHTYFIVSWEELLCRLILCNRRIRAEDLCTAFMSGVWYPCISSLSMIPKRSLTVRMCGPLESDQSHIRGPVLVSPAFVTLPKYLGRLKRP